MSLLSDLEASLYSESFHDFFIGAFENVMEVNSKYIDNWHIKELCDIGQAEVERIVRGEERKHHHLINVPIRSGKSLVLSVALNAWAWTRYPWMTFITASYSASLSLTLSRKTRLLIRSDWYQKRWGSVFQIKDDQDTKGHFETTAGGFRKTTSTNATITGEGAHICTADDLQNPQEAESEVRRKGGNTWFDETLSSRFKDPAVGVHLIVMQRLHTDDLTGHLQETGQYLHTCIPAELSDNVKPLRLREFYQDGLFFKARFTADVLKAYKISLRERGYMAQLGQSPKVQGGNIIKSEDLIRFIGRKNPIEVVQSWDTAFKKGQANDYSVCTTWHRIKFEGEERYHLIHVLREKMEFPELKEKAIAMARKFKPTKILIEDKASGQSLIQELQRDNYLRPLIDPVKVDTDKLSRVYSITPLIQDKKVLVDNSQSWFMDFIEEIEAFDSCEHDDQVDSFSQALAYFSGKTNQEPTANIRFL